MSLLYSWLWNICKVKRTDGPNNLHTILSVYNIKPIEKRCKIRMFISFLQELGYLKLFKIDFPPFRGVSSRIWQYF